MLIFTNVDFHRYLQSNISWVNNDGKVCNPGSWDPKESCAQCYCPDGGGNGGRYEGPQTARIVLGVFDTSDSTSNHAESSGGHGDAAPQIEAVAVGMYVHRAYCFVTTPIVHH